jgi:hypothetical protein
LIRAEGLEFIQEAIKALSPEELDAMLIYVVVNSGSRENDLVVPLLTVMEQVGKVGTMDMWSP